MPIVSETKPGNIFPARCPERHIEAGGSFCLGLDRPAVDDKESAAGWWEALRHHLMCQRMAHRSRIWPDAFALDHGSAGIWHKKALELAETLNLKEEYAAAHADEASWITGAQPKIADREGRPINGRAKCHLGCVWRKRGRRLPRLRVECDRREKFLELISIEKKRRTELVEYWRSVRRAGTICCGTMRNCELGKGRKDEPSN